MFVYEELKESIENEVKDIAFYNRGLVIMISIFAKKLCSMTAKAFKGEGDNDCIID